MIRKLVRQMLAAQVFSALTVSMCLLIDNVMISRYLGEKAIAAYGLADPILLAIGAIATLLASGVQVMCSKALGRGSQEEANAGYSCAIVTAAVVSVVFMAAVIPFRSFFARILGAGGDRELFRMTRDYLAGFCIGAPGSMGALVLVPFMQMAGQTGLLIGAVLTMTVLDIGLDLLNVLVFHGGMFGMGLASALSYYAAVAVGGIYFLSKKSVFRFSGKLVNRKRIAEIFRSGIPAGFNMLASVILIFLMNQLLRALDHGGSTAVAAYTVVMAIGNAANCITTGIGGVSLTLSGILFHEEDRAGLKELIGLLCRYGAVLGAVMGVVLLAFAPAFISVFMPQGGDDIHAGTREMAILGLRLFSLGLIPCCFNNALKNHYQASGRIGWTEFISMMEGAGFPVLAAFLFSRFMGTTGAWLGFAAGELLTLLMIGLVIYRRCGEVPWRKGTFLLLKNDFGAAADQMLEREIASMADVAAAAQEAEQFCMARGQNARICNHIALCIEEMAGNVVQHGFGQDGKAHHLSIRLLNKPDHWVLRFRDDCGAFDPVHFVPREEHQALGIRLVLKMAGEAHYTYSMNLNNLVLKIPKE